MVCVLNLPCPWFYGKKNMTHKPDPTIFIVDDDLETRNSLSWLMESVKLSTETFNSAIDFLKNYDPARIGCVLLDIRMPEMSGLELLDTLNAMNNRLPIIVITGHGDLPMAVRAMKSGAIDFILKPFNAQQLIEQIQKAIVQNANNVKLFSYKTVISDFATLTLRESTVMNLIVEGKLNKEIAQELQIAVSTVEIHRSRVMKKMHAKNITQLVRMKITMENKQFNLL